MIARTAVRVRAQARCVVHAAQVITAAPSGWWLRHAVTSV
jgi:hypothetical protein